MVSFFHVIFHVYTIMVRTEIYVFKKLYIYIYYSGLDNYFCPFLKSKYNYREFYFIFKSIFIINGIIFGTNICHFLLKNKGVKFIII